MALVGERPAVWTRLQVRDSARSAAGCSAAEAMVAGNLRNYECEHRALARRPSRMGRLMLWLDRNPKVRTRVISALQSKPELFARTLAMHVGCSSARDIILTGARLGWRTLVA